MRRWGFLAIPVAFAVDQATKAWALATLWDLRPGGIEVLPVLNLRLGFNTGITFGMFRESAAGAVWFLVAVKLAVVAWLLAWLLRRPEGRAEATGLGLVMGGALGNVLDRVRIGAVVDFLDVHYAGWHWPTFNMADVAIVSGVAMLAWSAVARPAPSNPEPGRTSA